MIRSDSSAPRRLVAWVLATILSAGWSGPAAAASLEDTLSFELSAPGGKLIGWGGGPPGTLFLDSVVVHGGRHAARIERESSSPQTFSALTASIPITFTGDTLELRGWLKTGGVDGFAGLWMRQDAAGAVVQFDNMQSSSLAGTNAWAEYRIALPLDRRARSVAFGALLFGSGTVHVDDLRLRVDGRSLREAPALVREPTVLDTDHEFDSGSRIAITKLSRPQVENLVLLAKIWGFLKYHHPRVTAGKLHWDYELFREMPLVVKAGGPRDASRALSRWLDRLGEPAPCSPCAKLPDSLHLGPRIGWIQGRGVDKDLAARLLRVHANRSGALEQFYVSLNPGVGNPDFSTEVAYAQPALPDAGHRLLALFRFWNVIEYWFPYRDLIGEDWDGVLREFIPRVVGATTEHDYRLTMIELVARVRDGHANVWNMVEARPPRGDCDLPVIVRWIEDGFAVTAFSDSSLGMKAGFRIGDVLRTLDGKTIDSLVIAWSPDYGASNESARRHQIGQALTKGACGPCPLTVERAGRRFDLIATRDSTRRLDRRAGSTHDLPGAAFRRLSKDVAYLKLSAVSVKEIRSYLEKAAGTRCFVVDIRNYPREFVPFALGRHLVSQPTPFARFTVGDLTNPGAFGWTEPVVIQPNAPHYPGAVVALVDEASISQSEYTAMAMRAAGATVVGGTTAGADGNVSTLLLPGGLRAAISGIGVFYPDKKPTQQIGIVPDVFAWPTIEGLRQGRDEVLEAAIGHVLGRRVQVFPSREPVVLDP